MFLFVCGRLLKGVEETEIEKTLCVEWIYTSHTLHYVVMSRCIFYISFSGLFDLTLWNDV